jgi:hypothetical protein
MQAWAGRAFTAPGAIALLKPRVGIAHILINGRSRVADFG